MRNLDDRVHLEDVRTPPKPPERAISPFPTVFSTRFENFLLFSSNSKLLSANSFNLEESKNLSLGKGLREKKKTLVNSIFSFFNSVLCAFIECFKLMFFTTFAFNYHLQVSSVLKYKSFITQYRL